MLIEKVWKENDQINLKPLSNSFKYTITEIEDFLNNPRFDLIVN